ncbi:Mitochondrial-processing peptidase subunit alpha, variant 2 [Balamuthia mandrillaris]
MEGIRGLRQNLSRPSTIHRLLGARFLPWDPTLRHFSQHGSALVSPRGDGGGVGGLLPGMSRRWFRGSMTFREELRQPHSQPVTATPHLPVTYFAAPPLDPAVAKRRAEKKQRLQEESKNLTSQRQPTVSMREPFPGTPEPLPLSALKRPVTRVTTMPNGLRVASEECYGQVSTVGVFVNAGSRYETPATNGVTDFLQRMAYKATATNTTQHIVQRLEELGTGAFSSSMRELMVYQVDTIQDHLPEVLEILANNIKSPQFLEEDMEEQRQVLAQKLEEIQYDPDTWISEVLHELAYGKEGLGLSQLVPPSNISAITREHLLQFVERFYVGPRVVVAAVGVEHAQFVGMAEKHFADVRKSSTSSPVVSPPTHPIYKGGEHLEVMTPEVEDKLHAMSQLDKPYPSHVVLAFEGVSLQDEDLYGACVLQTLMGGGSSFSPGGPGKGMYSRLYRNVLNQFHYVDAASAFNTFYEDTGMFGIYAKADHSHLGDMVQVMCLQLAEMAHRLQEEEVTRAKNQLKSSIFTNLESRSVMFDDIGRQIISYNTRHSAENICQKIDSLTEEDLLRVAGRLVASKPCLIAFAPEAALATLPPFSAVEEYFRTLPQKIQKARQQQKAKGLNENK